MVCTRNVPKTTEFRPKGNTRCVQGISLGCIFWKCNGTSFVGHLYIASKDIPGYKSNISGTFFVKASFLLWYTEGTYQNTYKGQSETVLFKMIYSIKILMKLSSLKSSQSEPFIKDHLRYHMKQNWKITGKSFLTYYLKIIYFWVFT